MHDHAEGIFGEDHKVKITLVCDKCPVSSQLMLNIDDMQGSLDRYGWYVENGNFLCYECNNEENIEWLSSEDFLKKKEARKMNPDHWK